MTASKSAVDGFIDAVRWRIGLVRLVENLAFALSCSALTGILLIAVAIWQSLPTMPILFSCLAIGLSIGCLVTFVNWPTTAFAAAQTDREFKLDELISSSLHLKSAKDQFALAVRNLADAQCRSRTPSQVVFWRFTAQQWGGVAFVLSIATILAVIPFGPARSGAADADPSALNSILSDHHEQSPALVIATLTGAAVPIHHNPMSDDASMPSSLNAADQSAQHREDRANAAAKAQAEAANAGSGGASSTSPTKAGHEPRVAGNAAHHAARSLAGGGGVGEKTAGEKHDLAAGGSETAENKSAIVALSPASDVQTQASRAAQRVNGEVNVHQAPAEHRDLVRDFFR